MRQSRMVSELKTKQRSARMVDDRLIAHEMNEQEGSLRLQTFDVKPLFHLVEDIVNRAIHNVNKSVMDTRAYMEDKSHKEEVIRIREKFSYKMDQISYKIAYNTSSGEDVHATTFSIIFETLSGYSWEAILILTLTAFALNYGECWHLALIYSSNQLGKSMAILKQVADVHKLSGLSAPPLEAVNDLVKAIMDVTRCIIEFQELGSQLDGSKDVEAYSAGLRQIPLTIYWIIRSVLASASQITSLTSLAFNYVISSTEKEELIFLTEKLNKKKKELKEQQNLCYPILDKATMNKRLGIIKSLLELPQVDNMNILRALIYYKDDQQPLIDGSNRKVDLDVLRKKLILLLISDVDIPQEDINVVKQIYHKSRDEGQIIKAENQFEIVWLPIVDSSMFTSSDYVNRKFKEKRSNMPWYSVNQPSLIAQEVVKLTREEWHFDKHPIIVVLDAQGQVASPNALPMMWVWRNVEYPFTFGAQEALWRGKTWNLDLLLHDIFPPFHNWMREEKCICLYGGEDMEWIKMFTTRAPFVAKAADVSLEMVYVGKREASEQVQRNIATITSERLSHSMSRDEQWRFWKRVVNMGHSRVQLGNTIYEDTILQEIVSLLNLDTSVWAAFGYKSDLVIKAKGNEILNSFIHFVEWKDDVETKHHILPALQNSLVMYQGQIDVIKHVESYEKVVNQFGMPHQIDCMKVLKALISGKYYSQPLYDGATKKRVNIDLLRRKELLLLVSTLNMEEMEIVKKIYYGIHKVQQTGSYAIVWIPIVDPALMRTEGAQKQFENLQAQMPWYSVHHPSMIHPAAIKFIKQVWGFNQKTILVLLDQQGRVSSPNALNLMWNWGTPSFPITNLKEKDPWKDITTLKLELLLDGLDSPIIDSIKNGKFICLYGGEDMEWIRKFTCSARNVADSAKIPLEMMYVGKSNPNERVLSNLKSIEAEKLSLFLKEKGLIRLFWYRIESMWSSRFELGKKIENDQIMQQLTTLLSFDGIEESGWALICDDTTEMVKGKGSEFLKCLLNYNEWKKNASQKGFLAALREKLDTSGAQQQGCYQLVLPHSVENLLPTLNCSLCHYPMERSVSFGCCG